MEAPGVNDKPTNPSTALSLQANERLSTSMHRAKLFPGIFNSEGALALILAGRELGFGPIASLTGIHLIKGKVTLSANLMAAAIRRSSSYDYRIVEHTSETCRIEFSRQGQVLGVSEFTLQDAVTAGLSGTDNWKKFRRNMLFARALSNGAKWHCPDVFAGQPIYTEDELSEEILDAEWTPAPAGAVAAVAAPVAVEEAPELTVPPQVSLGDLVAQYGADRVMKAAGGGIPANNEEVATAAGMLEAGLA